MTWKVRLNEWLDRRIIRWMDGAVCVSTAQQAFFHDKGGSLTRTTVVPNAVDVAPAEIRADVRKQLERLFSDRPHWIVGVGSRLSPEKGIDRLIETATIIWRHTADVGFVVFGEGPMRASLEDQISRYRLQSRFILPGYRRDFRSLLAHCDLAVLPSQREGMPNFVLEAMAAGLPIIATAVGGTPELIEDGRSGYLVAPNAPLEFANRILELVQDPQARIRMGAAAKSRVQSHFSFEAQRDAYERVFDRFSTETRQSRRKVAVL